MGDGLISIVIKWQGKEYQLDGLEGSTSVEDVKKQLQDKTSVRCENQKLIGLKHKKAGTAVVDATVLSDLNLKKNAKIMMMGTVDEEIEKVSYNIVFPSQNIVFGYMAIYQMCQYTQSNYTQFIRPQIP